MQIAVFGTGMVGKTLAARLVGLGHAVTIAGRGVEAPDVATWRGPLGLAYAAFADAATTAEMTILATRGDVVLDVVRMAGPGAFDGKVVIDVTNPLDTTRGGFPVLIPQLSNTTSAGEEVQRLLPNAFVVKTLNTMNHLLMVDPSRIAGPHDVFLCGNDADAKARVIALLNEFGWERPIDLGSIEAARGLEGLMPFWLRAWAALKTADFNYHLSRAAT